MITLDVICPAYCEEEGIEEFYLELKAALALVADRYRSRIIFVVDKSPDKTEEVVRRLASRDSSVALIALSSRFGHQQSLMAGLDHAQGDAVLMMDCDLEHPPRVIPELIAKFEQGYEIVCAIRAYNEKERFSKKVASKIYYRVMNALSDVHVPAGSADFRLISRKVCDVFKTRFRERNPFLRGLFAWTGFRTASVEYRSDMRKHGKTKYGWLRMCKFAATGLISFSKKPLRLAIYLGVISSVFAVFSALLTLYAWFFQSNIPPGWTTLAILVSFFGGMQLIFLGVMGEYLGYVFDEAKGRPLYIVDEKLNI